MPASAAVSVERAPDQKAPSAADAVGRPTLLPLTEQGLLAALATLTMARG